MDRAPLRVKRTTHHPHSLILGGAFKHLHFRWRPYEKRSAEMQDDYNRLFESMDRHGMQNPLICARGHRGMVHVLIGQRRCEIARDLGWTEVPCLEIQDDIDQERDSKRVLALRNEQYREASY